MTTPNSPQVTTREKPVFAARYAHTGWGSTLLIVGGLFGVGSFLIALLGLVVVVASPSGGDTAGETAAAGGLLIFLGVVGLLFNVALIGWGVFLVRGQGASPAGAIRREAADQRREARREAAEQRRIEDEKKRADALAQRAAMARDELAQSAGALSVASGGAALLAYRSLEATAKRWYPSEMDAKVKESLASIKFDFEKIKSPRLGIITSRDRKQSIEVFRDWIIIGSESFDVDYSTQAMVHSEGSIQISSTRDNNNRVVEKRHDLRVAEVQLFGNEWSLSLPIHPDRTMDVRKIIAQLTAHVDTLKPKGLTSADLRDLVQSILNNTGQPPAEKLKQLSNLRFDRILSDEEYEAAKSKILGIN